jgi:unsaturated chondroitin disaccharide hydrolase
METNAAILTATDQRQSPAPPDLAVLETALTVCVRKTRGNITRLADQPRAWSNAVDGHYCNYQEGFFEIGNWTSSFFTGMALLAWRETEDEYFLQQVLRLAPSYREKVFTRQLDTHHDLGFLYSLYSVALFKLTGDRQHREVGLRAAQVLSERFNEKGGFIRAWGHMNTTENENLAIVDCLMNLPLLYWASRETGDQKYHQIAIRHADMVLNYFVRTDDSVCHAFRFDLQTGEPIGPDNFCGHATDSYWARGATWAFYGFALSYRYTRDHKYLDAAIRLAGRFISQLDQEVVPVWDFKLSAGETPLRDSSAAAVAVCGFQELARHQAADHRILHAKQALLQRICCADYLNPDDACPGVLKNGQVGRARNVYTSWGDYFLMEALDHELKTSESFW